MTGRKSSRIKKRAGQQQINNHQQQPQQQPQDDIGSPPANIKREQPPPAQTIKKILKTETDEAKTLKNVFKSNPDTQMKEFIKKAVVVKPTQQTTKITPRVPAETHPPAVAQELLETDDDVADNLVKLFKVSKSYKNI